MHALHLLDARGGDAGRPRDPRPLGTSGQHLLESFPGIGVRAGQDRTGWEARAATLKVEPLPDPPFNPPSVAAPGS